MMDFSTVKGITIPEGEVTKIADGNGVVLWSAIKKAKVTITSVCVGINGNTSKITVNSPEPFAPDPSNPSYTTNTWTVECWEEPNCTIEVPIGTTIECVVKRSKANLPCCIIWNGMQVMSGSGTMIYTVRGDASVDVSDRYDMGEYGVITITDEGV